MILEGARKHDVDLAESFMVGDRWQGCGSWTKCGMPNGFLLMAVIQSASLRGPRMRGYIH